MRRVELLQDALAANIGDWRLIPYIQRHEFEALVLAGLPELGLLLGSDEQAGFRQLVTSVSSAGPEDINDGASTAPSKRLQAHIESYAKTFHGPKVVEATGLPKLRATCPHFDAWVTKLEGLAAGAAT